MNKNKKNNISETFKEFWIYVRSRDFLKNLGIIFLVLIGILLLSSTLLKMYTKHGQKLTLPDYTGMHVDQVVNDIKKNNFKIEILDSIHHVDKNGGEILSQNPEPKSQVKEGRKIYVTVSKYLPDLIKFDILPRMYGEDYDRVRKQLYDGWQINSKILNTRYDSGPPNMILSAHSNGIEVLNREGKKSGIILEKGSEIGFIVSKNEQGIIISPELICKKYTSAVAIAEVNKVILNVIDQELVNDLSTYYVSDQSPDFGLTIFTGDTIHIHLSQNKPFDCPDEFIENN